MAGGHAGPGCSERRPIFGTNMNIKIHTVNGARIGEFVSGETIIYTIEEATDLIGNLYYQDADKIILHENELNHAFFNLKNKLAGDILQKFSNYSIRLPIVGSLNKYPGKGDGKRVV